MLMKSIFTCFSFTVILAVVFAAGIAPLHAQNNAALTVQGILKKSDGSAVPDDVYTLKFAFYDAEAGGNKVWEETINDVETTGGVYSAVLGVGGTPLNAPFDKPYYLSVKIGNSSQELLPRPRLSAAPYALALRGQDNVVPSTGNIQAYGLTVANTITSGGTIASGNGFLANRGDMIYQYGPFAGYGFAGDGKTGYGSNAVGTASIWAGGENVINADATVVDFKKAIVLNGVKATLYTGVVRYLSQGNAVVNTQPNGGNIDFSMTTPHAIAVGTIWVTSDTRTKKDQTASNTANDLAALLRLRVTDYKYKDAIGKGDAWQKGVIAQEVRAVVPEAVSLSKEVVPDIYAAAKQMELRADGLRLEMEQAHGLKAGDKVRLITAQGETLYTVTNTPDAHTFDVSGWKGAAPANVFVFGREVADFQKVDYNRLFTLNIGATQEIARKVEALERENAGFKSENKELRRLIEGLRADIDALKGGQR